MRRLGAGFAAAVAFLAATFLAATFFAAFSAGTFGAFAVFGVFVVFSAEAFGGAFAGVCAAFFAFFGAPCGLVESGGVTVAS